MKAAAALAALVLAATAACSPVRRHTDSVDLRLAMALARAPAWEEYVFLCQFPRGHPLVGVTLKLLKAKGISSMGVVSVLAQVFVSPKDAERALAVLRSDPDLARYLLDTEGWRHIDDSPAVPTK